VRSVAGRPAGEAHDLAGWCGRGAESTAGRAAAVASEEEQIREGVEEAKERNRRERYSWVGRSDSFL
jgi:hypothetical protein